MERVNHNLLKAVVFSVGLANLGSIPPIEAAAINTSEIGWANHVIDASQSERPLQKQLKRFSKKIAPEQKKWQEVLETRTFFPRTSVGQQVEDFKLNYPFYAAAEEEFDVPAMLLFVTHEDETEASRNRRPESSGYVGAMQLAPEHFRIPEIRDAYKGWEFLGLAEQRYTPDKGYLTYDYKNIMSGAAFIARQRRLRSYPEGEAGALLVVRQNYSAEVYGSQRVARYLMMKGLYQDRFLDKS